MVRLVSSTLGLSFLENRKFLHVQFNFVVWIQQISMRETVRKQGTASVSRPELELLFKPGGLTCICRDTGMCHYFGYFFGVAPRFLGTFLAIPGFLGIIFWLFPDFGVSFFGKN